MDHPREYDDFTLPLQERWNDLYSFKLDPMGVTGTPKLAMHTRVEAVLWHRQLRHLQILHQGILQTIVDGERHGQTHRWTNFRSFVVHADSNVRCFTC